jgi:hypothetical protein
MQNSSLENSQPTLQQHNVIHRLRWMVKYLSENITDTELDEFESKVEVDKYMDNDKYEYSGNFILSENVVTRDEAVENMCCGIITKDVELSNGKTLYFAFDYGH